MNVKEIKSNQYIEELFKQDNVVWERGREGGNLTMF